MPKIAYISKKFRAPTLELIATCEAILTSYASQGYDMTLRQLYYQLVSRDIIPNRQKEYDRLGDIISNARLAGLIDWHHIVDRTRSLRKISAWESPEAIVGAVSQSYHLDRWANQSFRPEIWIEKDALAGVFDRVARELDVPLLSCRGYISQSEIWEAGQRMLRHQQGAGIYQQPYIIHFGDHDPSGIDMSRDIQARLELFGVDLQFDRLALNMNQIEQYAPPPNPTKLEDSRAKGYIANFGYESWELDALEPTVLAGLVRNAILNITDPDALVDVTSREAADKATLQRISDRYDDVKSYLEGE